MLSLAVVLAGSLFGCGSASLGEGVAATVNGHQITEQAVTDYVQSLRKENNLEDKETWGEWLASGGTTPEDIRSQAIDYLVNEELYDQAAEERGLTVEQAEVDAALEDVKSQFESEENFQQALAQTGMTEEEYIENTVRPALLRTKLAEAIESEIGQSTDEDDTAALLEAAKSMSSRFDGSKRTSHILLIAEDGEDDAGLAARAQGLLDQIEAGTIAFEEAAAQYSSDEATANDGGDKGWNALVANGEEYREAVQNLNKGDIASVPVKTDEGYEIIKVTDVYELPEGGVNSLDDIPAEFVEAMRLIRQSSSDQRFGAWFQEYRSGAAIETSPMPEGLPYAEV